jgi:hypothetical protein
MGPLMLGFRASVEATCHLVSAYRPGLQALGAADSGTVHCPDPRTLTGSVDIDSALRSIQPEAARWDYAIGHRKGTAEEVYWVEVHPASSHHIDAVLGKLEWLRGWLQRDAPKLGALTTAGFYWVATGASVAVTQNSPQAKRLAQRGLRGPLRRLLIK